MLQNEALTCLPQPDSSMAGRPNILVVEDDPDINGTLVHLLRNEGFRAAAALDGRSALTAATQDPPDAIVLDLMLPDITGFEVCQTLKLHRDTNLIPILMLTALTDARSHRSGLRVGANRYLTKPFEPTLLIQEIREALEHRRELAARQTHTSVELQMESDNRSREQLNDLLSELFVQTPLTDEQIGQIRYAAMEMIENAAEWGNRRRKELLVTIGYEVTADAVKFVITDQGPGFNPSQLPHAAGDDDPLGHMAIREKLGLREGGFGILISRGMVDEFSYNASGNQVTLVKYFRPRKNAAGA
jgi:DNA-binding response OmpR family regulator